MMTISVIVGSTRQGRFSEKPAQWILQQLHKREGIEGRLLDLRDFPMPFFDPAYAPGPCRAPAYEHEVVKKWTAQIAASDGFVFVTREYNYGRAENADRLGLSGVERKAAAFVSYGSAMGGEPSSSFARRQSRFKWHRFGHLFNSVATAFGHISRVGT